MALRNRIIKELQEIIKKDYGILLTEEEAQEQGESYLRLTKIMIRVENRKNNLRVARDIRTNKKIRGRLPQVKRHNSD